MFALSTVSANIRPRFSVDIFLNLEGGGTGGRAILFRANDTAVNGFYQKVPRPLGTTFLSDAYKLGALRFALQYKQFSISESDRMFIYDAL